jgi:hypothetical protein
VPWKSKKQQAWGHSPSGVKALGGQAKVHEWDSATDFSSLPKKSEDDETHPFLKRELWGK